MKKPEKKLLLPDEFVLRKDDILFVLKAITKHWKRDDFSILENAAYISNMELIKTAVRLNNPKVLKELFYSIITAVHEIETLNSLSLSCRDSPDSKLEILLEKQFQKIEDGSAFVEN